ncbi:MAG: sulfatase-like hydrolase/transferase [Propionibacteriaceae bacterium]|nr:sulfatase-like hydrolase/transferase [Propionibacteriaceae bacterium]
MMASRESAAIQPTPEPAAATTRSSPLTRGVLVTVAALALVWFALSVPGPGPDVKVTASTPLHLPLEALGFLLVILAIPARAERVRDGVALTAGALLGALSVLRLLDIGFREALGRPFNAVVDWGNVASGASLLRDAVGWPLASAVVLIVAVLVVALLAGMPLAVQHVGRLVSRHRRGVLRATTLLLAVWLLLTVADVRIGKSSIASMELAPYAYEELSSIPQGVRDQREFARATADDPLAATPTDRLLTALRGKDVLFVFVESYGRVALEDPELSEGITILLQSEGERLSTDGFSSRSAFLTSPTFGGISWLAHSSFQSGLWVDSKQRYDILLASERLTLSHAFNRAGWRTVVDVPANTADWSRQGFYDYDQLYDSRNVGYEGPRFGYPTIPDQYTLEAFQRLELSAPERQPVMAEIDLISSHAPWSPMPSIVPQDMIGDGSVYDDMPRSPAPSGAAETRKAYAASIEYSLGSVFAFLEAHGTDDTVLIFLGDHQPTSVVAGGDLGNDVPISIVAKDPAIFERISSWGWEEGLLPGPEAPTWRMDSFRDRLITTFGS